MDELLMNPSTLEHPQPRRPDVELRLPEHIGDMSHFGVPMDPGNDEL